MQKEINSKRNISDYYAINETNNWITPKYYISDFNSTNTSNVSNQNTTISSRLNIIDYININDNLRTVISNTCSSKLYVSPTSQMTCNTKLWSMIFDVLIYKQQQYMVVQLIKFKK